MFKIFGWTFLITIVGLVLGFLYGGPTTFVVVLLLCVLEVSLSFDNAVVNATILKRMSRRWQQLFLTVGVLIAVFGMRLVFPFVVVAATAGLAPLDAIRLAFEQGDPSQPGTYGYILHEAHPSIASFGGAFLLMLFLNFLLGEKELDWLGWIERPMRRLGARFPSGAVVIALAVIVTTALTLAEDPQDVLLYGAVGVLTYLLVDGLGSFFENAGEVDSAGPSGTAVVVGKAAFFLFLYLEVLDASFSFDGVIGAFAITTDPIIIAIGLGVGAFYIRSITIYLVRKGTLQDYPYLEHGALWAVGALAALLLISVRVELPEVVTGLVGVVFIVAGLLTSIVHNRRSPDTTEDLDEVSVAG